MRATLEFYRDKKREYRWRFKINGRIMADSGEGYTRRRAAARAFKRFSDRLQDWSGALKYDIVGLD